MGVKTKTELNNLLQTGYKINESDYQDLVDTFIIYEPDTQPVVDTGVVLLDCNNVRQAIFRPRLSSGARTINTNFTQNFSNDSGIAVIQCQYVFTGTIIITMEIGKVQVVEETLPSIYSWDSGLEQLTINAGTDDKVELNYFRDPDDSGKYTLVCGGVAI